MKENSVWDTIVDVTNKEVEKCVFEGPKNIINNFVCKRISI